MADEDTQMPYSPTLGEAELKTVEGEEQNEKDQELKPGTKRHDNKKRKGTEAPAPKKKTLPKAREVPLTDEEKRMAEARLERAKQRLKAVMQEQEEEKMYERYVKRKMRRSKPNPDEGTGRGDHRHGQ